MSINNISIRNRLFFGFGFILLLLAAISIFCLNGSSKIVAGFQNSNHLADIGKSMLHREIDHERFLARATQFFLDPRMTKMEVETDHTKCKLGTWLYGAERVEAEKAIPELSILLKDLEKPHEDLHESIKSINSLASQGNRDNNMEEIRSIYSTRTQDALSVVKKNLQEVITITERYNDELFTALNDRSSNIRTVVLTLAVLALFIGISISFLISYNLSQSLTDVVKTTEALTNGNISVRSKLAQKDEVGILASSTNDLAGNLENVFSKVRGSSSTINASAVALEDLAISMHQNSSLMLNNSTAVASASEQMKANISGVAAASEQTSTNISMVATATEEMTATISEIAASSEQARLVTDSAVKESVEVSQSVVELGKAAQEINKVTETINEIAEQTNLLALNATIEAARAGEAGKGFAVVANEIKELAKQTTEATSEIKERIDGVQSSSDQTIKAINSISETISSTSDIVSTMAAAVEEQAVTSKEIAENVAQASQGMEELNQNFAEASVANSEVAEEIAKIKKEAEDVTAQSLDVKELSLEMKSNGERFNDILKDFTFKEEKFPIGKIKNAHFQWKMRLGLVLNGFEHIQPEEIPDHHQCDFGKWYDNAPAELKLLPVFAQIAAHHKEVHLKVSEAVKAHNQGNDSEAKNRLDEFEIARKELFECLDELYTS